MREREREKGMGERMLSFFFVFNIFFFPSDTPSQRCLGRVSGVCEHTHQSRCWRGSQRCKEWESVWESASHIRRDVWGFVWFTDGCLLGYGGVATYAVGGKIYLSHFFPLLSHPLSLILPTANIGCRCYTHKHTPSHTQSRSHTHTFIHFSPKVSWVSCVVYVVRFNFTTYIYFFKILIIVMFSQWYLFNFPLLTFSFLSGGIYNFTPTPQRSERGREEERESLVWKIGVSQIHWDILMWLWLGFSECIFLGNLRDEIWKSLLF